MTFEEFKKQLNKIHNYNQRYNKWFAISDSSEHLESPEAFQKRAINKIIRAKKHEMKKQERLMLKTGFTLEDQKFMFLISDLIFEHCDYEHFPTFQILRSRYIYANDWDSIALRFQYADRSTVEGYAKKGLEELYQIYKERSNENEGL